MHGEIVESYRHDYARRKSLSARPLDGLEGVPLVLIISKHVKIPSFGDTARQEAAAYYHNGQSTLVIFSSWRVVLRGAAPVPGAARVYAFTTVPSLRT